MIEKLKEKRAALIAEMEKLMEGKEQLTADERKAFDDMEVKVQELDGDIERAEKLASKKEADPVIPGPAAPALSEKMQKDLNKYSITRAIRIAADPKLKLDGVELEMHQEAGKEMKAGNLELQGLGIPSLIHSRDALKATVAAQGGYTVATETMGLIETLRNSMVSVQAGATVMTGLVGDVKFPKRTADSTATWRSEGGVATQSDPTYGQVLMQPKRLTTYSEFNRQLLIQSSLDVEAELRNVLYYAIANALETAVYTGSGTSNQPTGILNATGVNDGDHGSNGTVLNWNNIVQLETMVAVDNALRARLAYVTNATAAGAMKTTLKNTYQGGYIWEMFTPLNKGLVNGYDAYITNCISHALTRGTGTGLSAVIFGDWSQLMIGQWGALDLIVNPYSLDTYGVIRVTVAGYYDIAVKQAAAFAAIAGLETT